jgi:rRNA maturation RNase YbeY
LAIHFHESNATAGIRNRTLLKHWLVDVIENEQASPGTINIIFTSDEDLSELNRKYLSSENLTDVISFNYTENQIIEGDIYVSVPRVRENAERFNVLFQEEMKRVMVHGLLHLLGYQDKTNKQQLRMRRLEDSYLLESPKI